jgi:hypothetical protein
LVLAELGARLVTTKHDSLAVASPGQQHSFGGLRGIASSRYFINLAAGLAWRVAPSKRRLVDAT